MTKLPDWESAVKAALVVAKCAGPPFRYQVIGIPGNPPSAITLTKWTAFLVAKALTKAGQGTFTVHDMDGNQLYEEEDD